MIIRSAEFLESNSDVRKCPQTALPEYAFIGRSNVGKSSLINMLAGTKGLALTSQTPGKTLLINHFIVNKEWHLVDLPGYGYARRNKEGREKIKTVIEDYILEREQLICLFVLIDIRLEPQKIDIEFIEWLGENGIPFAIVYTKADKQTATRNQANIRQIEEKLLETWEELPPSFLTSAETKAGRDALLNYIEQINLSIVK